MTHDLQQLELRRMEIFKEISSLGDFRAGSITSLMRRCGKKECHCSQAGDPGHGPTLRLTYNRKGKSYTEMLPDRESEEKARREIAEFRRFQELSKELVEISGQICRLRPAEDRESEQSKKKLQKEAIQQEVRAEVERLLQVIIRGWEKSGWLDLEAVEMMLRDGMHRAGAAMLTSFLQYEEPEERLIDCVCGEKAGYIELRPKQLLTAVGAVSLLRPYYLCQNCRQGQSPVDKEIDVEGSGFSPGVRRMMAMVGCEEAFEKGREQIKSLAGLEVTAKAVERTSEAIGAEIERRQQNQIQEAVKPGLMESAGSPIPILYIEMDGTGVPVRKSEVDQTQGKQGEVARTREAKLGCVFTQTSVDKEQRPVRDPSSTTYVGAIESASEFGARIYAEARQRGLGRAARLVVLADGALWIWNIVQSYFPGAIEIVDLYHAREHLWKLAAKLFPSNQIERKRWIKRFQSNLDRGRIKKLVSDLRAITSTDLEMTEAIQTEADYFERNAHRMQYPKFKAQKLFVGSGVIEAGCKTVVGSRLKQSGMFWTVEGANSILALRCSLLNGCFEDYWEDRLPSRAA